MGFINSAKNPKITNKKTKDKKNTLLFFFNLYRE